MSKLLKSIIGQGNQKKVIKGVFWSFLGTIISKGFLFIALFLVARNLTVEEYGKLGLLQSYINTFTFFSLASFGITATKYLALYVDSDIKMASEIYSLTRVSVFIIAFLILIFSLLFNSTISHIIVGDIALFNEVLICSFTVFFSSMNGLQIGALAGLEDFKSISIVSLINGLISLPLILFVSNYYGLKGIIYAILVVNFLIWISSAILLQKKLNKKHVVFTFSNFKYHLDTLYHFTLPNFLSSLMMTPVVLVCNTILIKNNKNGLYEMGIYNVAMNFSQFGTVLIRIIGQVVYPMAIKNFGKKNRKFDFFNINQSYIIGVILFIPIIILPDFFASIYGDKYEKYNVYLTLIFVSLSMIIVAQRQGIARNFAAANYMWFSVFGNLLWGVSTIILSYIFVDKGAYGRSLAFFIGYLVNTIIFIPFYINRKLIDKELILSKNHGLLIVCFIISSFVFSFIDNFLVRILICLVLLSLVMLTFKLWYKKYVYAK
jgi:O-antigen/teichoic acid export membrane protein